MLFLLIHLDIFFLWVKGPCQVSREAAWAFPTRATSKTSPEGAVRAVMVMHYLVRAVRDVKFKSLKAINPRLNPMNGWSAVRLWSWIVFFSSFLNLASILARYSKACLFRTVWKGMPMLWRRRRWESDAGVIRAYDSYRTVWKLVSVRVSQSYLLSFIQLA